MNRTLDIIGFVGLLFLILCPLFYYAELPDKIPTHYGFSGNPDNYGGKSSLWLLVGIGTLLYIGLIVMSQNIHRFSFQKKLTEKQANHSYHYNKRILQISAISTTWLFGYINFATIQNALGNMVGLGRFFMPVLITITLSITTYQVINARKLKKIE